MVIYVKNDEHRPKNGDSVTETLYTLNWPFIDVKTMNTHQKTVMALCLGMSILIEKTTKAYSKAVILLL